jgi:hypothetical protein
MSSITKKASLAEKIKKMRKMFPKDFNFHPKTWILPN